VVSEITSSMLVILIVISIGIGLVLAIFSNITSFATVLERSRLEYEIESKTDLAIALVTGYTNGTISIVLCCGEYPVDVVAVYVNNTLAANYEPALKLKPYTTVILSITSPVKLQKGDVIYVRVIYGEWGEKVERAGQVFQTS